MKIFGWHIIHKDDLFIRDYENRILRQPDIERYIEFGKSLELAVISAERVREWQEMENKVRT